MTDQPTSLIPIKGTKDEEFRMRCIEAACLAVSGSRHFVPEDEIISKTQCFEQYVKTGTTQGMGANG